MRIEELVGRAENERAVKKALSEGYFLSAIFIMLDGAKPVKEWRLIFFNPHSKKMVEFFYNGAFEKGEVEERDKDILPLDISEVKIEIDDALKTAKGEFDKKSSSKVVSYLISLHPKKIDAVTETVWTISMIYAGMRVQTYDIDAATGEILDEESASLMTVG
jgi:hypothetical protein